MVSQRRNELEVGNESRFESDEEPAQAETPRAANSIPEQRILDAAYDLLLATGMRRMSMADIARRADISRATLYRRWPNVRAVVAALVTREFTTLAAQVESAAGTGRGSLVSAVTHVVGELRVHPLVRKIVDVDPEFLVPYLFHRTGATSDAQLGLIEDAIRQGQEDGSVRAGSRGMLARAVLLTAWSFTLSGPVFVPEHAFPELDGELSLLLERYLAP
ncbi:TetR/AcrR family transcriptional regulator [Parasphingorhabdus pacifica]